MRPGMEKTANRKITVKYLKKRVKGEGLAFDIEAITYQTILETFKNEEVLDAWLTSIRKQLDMVTWIQKYGASKKQSELYKVPNIKMIDDSFSTLDCGHRDGIH